MRIGDPVRFAQPGGSWGVITAPRDYDNGWYVCWHYGLDELSQQWTAIASVAATDLLPLDREVFGQFKNCRAFSLEQKAVQARITSLSFVNPTSDSELTRAAPLPSVRNFETLRDELPRRDANTSIVQPWAAKLGLRHQGVLVSAIRGCDSVEREDPSKWLVRCYRGVLLRAHCGDLKKAASFMVPFDQETWDHTCADFFRSIDHYPNHWLLHFMHAAEIVGYKCPHFPVSVAFRGLYLRLVKKFHLNPETEAQLDGRLNVDEQTFKAAQV